MSLGVFLLTFMIKSYLNRNRNDYDAAIKSKDWEINLRDNLNFCKFKSYLIAILSILCAILGIYLKLRK